MPSLVYKVLLEVYSRVSLVAEHRLHPAELAEQVHYVLYDVYVHQAQQQPVASGARNSLHPRAHVAYPRAHVLPDKSR